MSTAVVPLGNTVLNKGITSTSGSGLSTVGTLAGTGATTGVTPVTAVPNVGNPLTTVQNNPFAAASAVPATAAGATTTGITNTSVPTVQSNGINWTDGSNTITGDLKDTYGAGTGTAISSVLQGLGTSTDNAVQATLNNINLQAGKQYANIQAQEAASGVTANSSTAALAAGDFYSGVNAQEQQTISGMELNEEDTLLQTLLGEGAAHGTDPSAFDSILNGISDAGSLVSGLTSLVPGIGTALGKIPGLGL